MTEDKNPYLTKFNKSREEVFSSKFNSAFKKAHRDVRNYNSNRSSKRGIVKMFSGEKNSPDVEMAQSYIDQTVSTPKKYHVEEGEALANARRLIRDGVKHGDLIQTMYGARVYEKMGLADRHFVVNGVCRAYQKATNETPRIASDLESEVGAFITEHGPGAHKRIKQKTVVSSVVAIIAVLFFLSANITGNVIGFNQTSSNWIGGLFFLAGLAGAFV